MEYVSISQAIKAAADLNTPSTEYLNNFLPAYRKYHKRQNVRRAVCKIGAAFAIFVVACISFAFINNVNKLDIQTASGSNMSNHNVQYGKTVIFEGDVRDVTNFVHEHVKCKTETLSLKEYFEGADVWGVCVPGEDKFRMYYQAIGHGRYTVFLYNE